MHWLTAKKAIYLLSCSIFSILCWFGEQLWNAKEDLSKRMDVIETLRQSDHEMLVEMRADIKELIERARK